MTSTTHCRTSSPAIYRKRNERRLQALVDDLGKADLSLDTYRPLSELQRALGESEPLRSGPALELVPPPAEAKAAPEGGPPDQRQKA